VRQGQILDAALELVEEVGVNRLSMRSIAARVSLSPMALYRHFESREELLDALVGRVLSGVAVGDPSFGWAEQLRALGRSLLSVAIAHPASFNLVLTRPYRAPEAIRVMQATEHLLQQAGVPADDRPRIERFVSTALIGFAAAVANGAFWSDGRPDGTPMNPEEEVWADELELNIKDLALVIEANTVPAT
jgi:AcrR family transcriptional regulator